MINTVYKRNKTMELLGKQYYNRVCNKEIWQEIGDITDAYTETEKPILTKGRIQEMMLDAYTLGFIYGQRKERARRKK